MLFVIKYVFFIIGLFYLVCFLIFGVREVKLGKKGIILMIVWYFYVNFYLLFFCKWLG